MSATILPFRKNNASAPPAGQPDVSQPDETPKEPAAKPADGPAKLERTPRALTAEERKLQDRMFEAYFDGRRVTLGHTKSTIEQCRAITNEFLEYVGQPVWLCTERDFESWCASLVVERELARTSVRRYQSAIGQLFKYLHEDAYWQGEARRQFDQRIQLIVTDENRMIHTTDANGVRERIHLSAEDFERFFQAYDEVVLEVAQKHPRRLKTMQRDRAMYFTTYSFALRRSELCGLNHEDFFANPDLPELGRFGLVKATGKGSRGSGPRHRIVEAVRKDCADMLTWYYEEVRPKFKCVDDNAKRAVWLSERGTRISKASFGARYQIFTEAMGLDPSKLAPHGLRHMAVSHEAAAGIPLSFTQHRVGHSYASTTQLYTHLPDGFMRDTAMNLVRASLKDAGP